MAENSKIEWTHHTFNPWMGCSKVSAGCKNCYAEAIMDHRYGKVKWGPDGTRQRTKNWREPLAWHRLAKANGVRQRVFCASLADVFEDFAGLDAIRADLWPLVEQCDSLDWLLLTKRPENARRMVPARWLKGGWPSHVAFGTSVEGGEASLAHNRLRMRHALSVPAPMHFLSCEPLIGSLGTAIDRLHYFKWVIVGGESGDGARPMDLEWARSIRDECRAHGVPFFFKQMGGVRDKGGRLEDIPEDLRIRETPWGNA